MNSFNPLDFASNPTFVGVGSLDTPGQVGDVRVNPVDQQLYVYTGSQWTEISGVSADNNSYIAFKQYFSLYIGGKERFEGDCHYRILLNSPYYGSCGIRFTASSDLMAVQQVKVWNFEKEYIIQLKNEDTGKIFIDTYAAFVFDPSDIYTI